MATYTQAGDASVYNKDTDVRNEYAYLQGLIESGSEGEKAWAVEQQKALLNAAGQQGAGSKNPNTNPTATTAFPGGTDSGARINEMYDSYVQSQIAQAQAAANKSNIALKTADANINTEYAGQRNATAANTNQAQAAFNEYALANGLNSGAGGQAMLSRQNAYQGAMSTLNSSEASSHADIQAQRAQIAADLQAAIAQAQATGNYQKAQALLENARYLQQQQTTNKNSEYSRKLQIAETLAAYGDFSGYKALGYSDEQIAAMQAAYNAEKASNYRY